MNVLAITRKSHFSPNHVGNDALIFDAVCSHLTAKGFYVEIIDEDDCLARDKIEQDVILMMGRTKALIAKLQKLEDKGTLIVNSAYGIEHCFRKNMTERLLANKIPYPQSYVVETNGDIGAAYKNLGNKGVWVKRGDFHAINKEDVTFAASRDHAQSILSEYALRGIEDAVVSEHLIGDLIKFYAVRGTDFFYSFYPYEHNHHKYAIYEQVNGDTLHYPYDHEALKKTADKAAAVLGVHIYGGDAIIGPDGNFHIIDLNDWPSFAPCKEEAAPLIADFFSIQIKERNAKKQSYTAE